MDCQKNLEMSVFGQHKDALAELVASHGVSDAFILEEQTCARLASLADPRGSKVHCAFFVKLARR